jgi:hypothetical protein
MTGGYSKITGWNAWTVDCPEGTWVGRLDEKVWGKSSNIILHFTEQATGRKAQLSVFSRNRYCPGDNGHDFLNDAEPGDTFELTTKKTRFGNPYLISARKTPSM